MNEFTVWIQNNWYELGTLLSEFVFLSAGIWFARKILKTMRASQEQVGALLKLSVTGGASDRPAVSAAAEKSLAASPYWLTPSEVPAIVQQEQEQMEQGPGRLALAGRSTLNWLRAPMNNRQRVAPWRKAVRWLQSPAGN